MKDLLIFTNDYHRYPELPLALEGMGIAHPQEPIVRSSGIPTYQWVQTVEGCGSISVDGKELLVPDGHGIFIPANKSHEYSAVSSSWVTNFLCFNGSQAGALLHSCGFDDAEVYRLEEPQCILHIEQQIYNLSVTTNSYKHYEISKLLYDIILDLSRLATCNSMLSNKSSNKKAIYAVRFMEEHFAEPISLSEIADSVGLSREYFCSAFKVETGISVFDYLQDVRIAKAKTYLLKYPEKTVKEIAAMAGFANSSYFGSVFKKFEHMTPNEFRNSRR